MRTDINTTARCIYEVERLQQKRAALSDDQDTSPPKPAFDEQPFAERENYSRAIRAYLQGAPIPEEFTGDLELLKTIVDAVK